MSFTQKKEREKLF